MKNIHNFLILGTILFSFIMIGCEQKVDLTKSIANDEERITNRYVDNCGDCPNMDDCCGSIELISGDYIEFETCGTTDGDAATCSDDIDGCEEIDGLKNSTTQLDSQNPRVLFCMQEDHSFIIKVLSIPIGGVVIRLTSQEGVLNPQTINVNITAIGTYVFSVLDGCIIEQCYP